MVRWMQLARDECDDLPQLLFGVKFLGLLWTASADKSVRLHTRRVIPSLGGAVVAVRLLWGGGSGVGVERGLWILLST